MQILVFADLDEAEQEQIFNTICCGLMDSSAEAAAELNADMEAYLMSQIKQIANDQISDIDVSRN